MSDHKAKLVRWAIDLALIVIIVGCGYSWYAHAKQRFAIVYSQSILGE